MSPHYLKPPLLLFLTIFLTFISKVFSGTLKPYSVSFIDTSVANRGQAADYSFNFIPETSVPVGGIFRVIFPTQYDSGLGLAGDPQCSTPCTVNGYTVDFTLTSELVGTQPASVTIYKVKNPITKGGTGNFQVMTLKGVNVLDENLIFDVIGIGDTVGQLTSTLVAAASTGVSSAGETTRYAFQFKVGQLIPANSYMRFTVNDKNFQLTRFPACNAFPINGKVIKGRFVCEAVGRNIYVRGLGVDIPANQDVGISVAMINPSFSGISDTFTIAVLRDGTKMIYDLKEGVPGVRITAGVISEISILKVDKNMIAARSKTMDYILTFKLKNGLTRNNVITLRFPPSFPVIGTQPIAQAYIMYGLDDIGEDNTVNFRIDTANNIITITNFLDFIDTQQIALYLRVTNPNNVGETTPINIRTYLDSFQTLLVDEDVTNAFTVIEDVAAPSAHTIPTPYTIATLGAANAPASTVITNLIFETTTSITVPAGGTIKVRVPDGFSIGSISNTQCRLTDSTMAYVASASCSNLGNTIIIVLPGTVSFPLTVLRRFTIDGIITTPSINGTFLFDVTTYLNDQVTVIESWTDYFVVTPAPFPSYSLTTLDRMMNRRTVLTATFTTGFVIPAGISQNKASDVKGFLEFEFLGGYTSMLTLGQAATDWKTPISCVAQTGLVAISGTVRCYLIQGTAVTDPAKIRVENFQEIAFGTPIIISFPNILNPTSAGTVKMKTIKLLNRVRTEFNSISLTLAVDTVAAALVDTVTTSPYAYTFTSLEVSRLTTLTFNPNIAVTLSGPGNFIISLPMYDIGWIPTYNSIVCRLGGVVYSCNKYAGADWVTIPLSSGQTYSAYTPITLSDLKVPRYQNPYIGGIVVRYVPTATVQHTIIKNMNTFPIAVVPKFSQATILCDTKNSGAVDATYTLVFVPPNDIPEGSSIIISFPTGYNLLTSTPPVSYSTPELIPISGKDKVSFVASISKVTVTGFKTHPAASAFSIVVSGVKNPSDMKLSQTWNAEVKFNGMYLVSHSDFDKFIFTDPMAAAMITFNSIDSFPLNAGEEADYRINFVPPSEIPQGGEIRITFPTDNYANLPSPPDCKVFGGITTFSKCTLSANTYTIELDSKYSGGGIIVRIKSVRNADRGTTSGFVVRTYYDGVILHDTDPASLSGRTLTLMERGDNALMKSLSFDPRNEGEQATYTFSFLPTNPVESSMEIKIIFPGVYDTTLGENIQCAAALGLIGTVSCTVSDRTVTVSGFDTYLPDAERPIVLKISGVTNPNLNLAGTGQFKVATLYTGNEYFTDYNAAFGSLNTLAAPGWAVLYSVEPENLNTRLQADYIFNFTSFAEVPKTSSEGAVLVYFPIEFDIPDGDINCDSITTSFSPTIQCAIKSNIMSIQGQTEDYKGNVKFVVRNIQNPIESGTAKNIVLKTYDGLNARIVERSFKNLDPFIFSYQYPGPLITVNNDEPIVAIRGTQTNDLYVTVESPCALNLTLKPFTPGFSIIPFKIELPLGSVKTKFRLSVPQSFPEGTYEVEWEKLGDIIPQYYTPLKKTVVKVIQRTEMTITVPKLNPVPLGGNSLPSALRIVNGPDIDIEVTINFLISYPGITLNTTKCFFNAGQKECAFIIYSSSDTMVTGGVKVEKGTLLLSLTGINQDIYTLSQNSVEFKMSDTDLIPPEVNSFDVSNVTQTSAIIDIQTSEVCLIYHMLALAGTVPPSLEEIKANGVPTYSTTRSVYGLTQVFTDLKARITFDNLIAETPYVFYIYLVDGGNMQSSVMNKTFKTTDRYNAVDFSLKFKQLSLNQAERQLTISAVSFILSLSAGKLQQKKYTIDTSRRLSQEESDMSNPTKRLLKAPNNSPRVLQEEVFVLMALQIAANPESAVFPSPKNLALSLNNKKIELFARLPNVDPDYTIEAYEFIRYQPSFPSKPNLRAKDSTYAAFNGMLNNYGHIFISCVKKEEDHGVPTPYQIMHGFDNRNIQMAWERVEVSEPYKTFVINVTGLTPNTTYTAYIIGGSAHPGYPDPMDDEKTVKIQFITAPESPKAKLNVKGATLVKVTFSGLLVIMGLSLLF